MKIFDSYYLDVLTAQAKASSRLRQHDNIHQSYQNVCQRLFNAIEPGSYIRPHRHVDDTDGELLIAIRGTMALMTFDDCGVVTNILRFGADRNCINTALGVQVSVGTWHTLIALEPGCVLLEVKPGPFDPHRAKDFAVWAPEEGSEAGCHFLSKLIKLSEDFAKTGFIKA